MINQEVKRRLGGLHSARSIMLTVDLAEIEAMQMAGRWDDVGAVWAEAAQSLDRAGADCLSSVPTRCTRLPM